MGRGVGGGDAGQVNDVEVKEDLVLIASGRLAGDIVAYRCARTHAHARTRARAHRLIPPTQSPGPPCLRLPVRP